MRDSTTRRAAVIVPALALLATLALWRYAHADTPEQINIAIPADVTIVLDQTVVIFTGRSSSINPVSCAPGTPWPQTAVAVNPAQGRQAEISGVIAFHDHEVPAGTQYLITGGGTNCNSELKLFQGTRL